MRLIAFVVAAAAMSGCGLAGRVYIAFFWADSETPDAGFTCTAPNVPALTAIVRGRYYETLPGRYTLSYSYTTPPVGPQSLSLVLAASETMLGQEHVYYNVTLRKLSPPTVARFP